MNIKYYITHKENTNGTILICITHNYQRVYLSSGISINTKDWNKKFQRVKPTSSNSFRKNQILSDIENFVNENYRITNNIDVNLKNVKKDVLQYITNKKVDVNNSISFSYYYNEYLKENIENNKFKASTVKQKKVTLSFINQMNPNLSLNDIDIVFFEEFTKFLIDKEYTNVYVKKQINQIKAFLNNYALPKKLITNIEYIKYSLKELHKNYTAFIALSEDEIELIKGLNLNDRLEKVRDLFIFQCYTGLRVSDLLSLKRENYNIKDKLLNVYTMKTSKVISIPLVSTTIDILIKYDYSLPVISDVKYNKYIKEVCEIANINEVIYNIKHIGNKKIEYTKLKYEMVSSHTARRTFITRLLKKGMLPEKVMKLSGHTNRTVFDEYVKITQNEAIDDMRNLL